MFIIFFIVFNILSISSIYGEYLVLNNKCFIEYYDINKKIPSIVYYYLTEDQVNHKNLKRITYFKQDKRIPKKYRTKYNDYKKQYIIINNKKNKIDRGHLVGNNIVNYDIQCQKYSFLMSNITPQTIKFNRSVFKKIEKLELNYAKKYKKIFVIVGNFDVITKIKNNISVPKNFFVIIKYKEFTKVKILYIILNQNGEKININNLNNKKIIWNLIQNILNNNKI